MFTKEQVSFMEGIGLKLDFSALSDNDYIKIEEKVGDAYTSEAQRTNKPTPTILMCESILDKLSE